MKRMNAVVKPNDRIVVNYIDHDTIQYMLVEAKTKKVIPLGKPFKFALSVKNYFSVKGRLIKELYDFKAWHNPKLQKEMKRIWRMIDALEKEKEIRVKNQQKQIHKVVDDERAA